MPWPVRMAQGIMHLDIKPANVMISSTGQHLVMDFGIARSISQLPDASGGITGTPQYMAPETISAQGAEFRSDIFSVGIMLYEMVTGTPVVEGGNVFQILNRNAHEKAEAPSSRNVKVDEKLEWIILKAIAKKPEERFSSAVAMRQALLNYLDSSKGTDGRSARRRFAQHAQVPVAPHAQQKRLSCDVRNH